jgi:tetratricopeptide (TPR) repeat protein
VAQPTATTTVEARTEAPLTAETAARQLLEGGRPRESLVELERAAAVQRRAGDAFAQARVALARSRARLVLGELEEAARQAEEAAADTSDPAFRVEALTHVSRVATGRSDFARAEAALAEALPIAERNGDDSARARVFRALGSLEYRRGRLREAYEHHTQAARAADRSGDMLQRVGARLDASAALLGLARYDDALATAQESYDIAAKPGTPPAVRARALFANAQANAHVWNLDRSAELWTAAIEASTAANESRNVATALKQSVETWFALGDFDRASADGQKAVELLGRTGQPQVIAETVARVALSELRRGRADEARRWADRARAALADAPESRHHYVHNDLGIVAAEIGDLARPGPTSPASSRSPGRSAMSSTNGARPGASDGPRSATTRPPRWHRSSGPLRPSTGSARRFQPLRFARAS